MLRHWRYFCYILRHKWFVLRAGKKIGLSLCQALTHDLGKFRPSEWLAYAHCFYLPSGTPRCEEGPEFKLAWLMHQHRNPHHWQFWQLQNDDGTMTILPMPPRYIKEMVADWVGAGTAITGANNVRAWYNENKANIRLNALTRAMVEVLIRVSDPKPFECIVCGHQLACVDGACAYCMSDAYRQKVVDEEMAKGTWANSSKN